MARSKSAKKNYTPLIITIIITAIFASSITYLVANKKFHHKYTSNMQHASQNTADITVTVLDAITKEPISDATVTLKCQRIYNIEVDNSGNVSNAGGEEECPQELLSYDAQTNNEGKVLFTDSDLNIKLKNMDIDLRAAAPNYNNELAFTFVDSVYTAVTTGISRENEVTLLLLSDSLKAKNSNEAETFAKNHPAVAEWMQTHSGAMPRTGRFDSPHWIIHIDDRNCVSYESGDCDLTVKVDARDGTVKTNE